MNFGDYDKTLDALRAIGNLRCCYAGDWPDSRCDCKFGGPVLKDHPILGSHFRIEVDGGEQTGCPELRTIYMVLDEMGEDLFNRVINQRQMKNTQTFAAWWEEHRASQES